MGQLTGGTFFYIDGDAWTCPNCGYTYRSNHSDPVHRRIHVRWKRNQHKCEDFLPR